MIDFLSNNSLRPFIILEYIHINHEVFKKPLRTLETEKYQYIKIEKIYFVLQRISKSKNFLVYNQSSNLFLL